MTQPDSAVVAAARAARSRFGFALALAAALGAASPGCTHNGTDQGTDARPDSATTDLAEDLPEPEPAATGLDTRPLNATCIATDARPPQPGAITLERIWPELELASLVLAVQAPDDPQHWFLVERTGRILRIAADPEASTFDLVANLRTRIDSGPGEAGLLSIAFHPRFAENDQVFLSYTRRDPLTSRFSRVTYDRETNTIDLDSEQILLEVPQPYGNHNGGHIAFGPDGRLYIALGDGGSSNDPLGSGQDTSTLLGSILRIDVDTPSAGLPYGIPPDNPFADGQGGRPEIFAWGLRNPWRFSFDRATGELWAGDVGQNAVEEIDRIELGGNYGWNVREGSRCFQSDACAGPFIDPVVEHPQSDGERSITGGYVYRGSAMPGFVGSYIYGDFVSGRIFAIVHDAEGQPASELLLASGLGVASFAEGLDGELMVVDYGGSVRRIVPAEPPGASDFPTQLSQTGCVDAADPRQPAAGLVPYAPIAELWSDGADKRRWLALPDGERLTVAPDGDLEFPVGSVLVKLFERGGRPIETRLFMHHPSGWAGYSYAWDAHGTDATLLEGSERRVLDDGSAWYFPSRGDCMVCHTSAAGFVLGVELAQLDHDLVYPSTNRRANQRATLEHIGLLDADAPGPEPLVAPHGDGDLEARARSYLHANCSNCHRPGGRTPSAMDLRAGIPLRAAGICDVVPDSHDLGLADARIVAAGDASRSVLPARMRQSGLLRMPPLATLVVDEAGAGLVHDWIEALAGCP